MAGSFTLTTSKVGALLKYQVDWLSDASGDVNTTTMNLPTGVIERVKYIPDGGGTQPTDAYDVTLPDANSIDLLVGTGANLSNATSTVHVPVMSTYFPMVVEEGAVTPTVANAGNAKGGIIEILIRPL